MKLKEIADKISSYLEKFEKDPKINIVGKGSKMKLYYCARSWSSGSRVFIRYIDFQGDSSLTKSEAEEYLKWLDEGNVGKQFEMERERKGIIK